MERLLLLAVIRSLNGAETAAIDHAQQACMGAFYGILTDGH